MKLTPLDLKNLSELASKAARRAGTIIAEATAEDSQPKAKVAGESLASQVVTEVDLKAQTAIVRLLQPTLQTYELGLLTEESTDDLSRFKEDYFWCIDPLDGTLPFTEKKAGYAVSIALVAKSGVPQLGVVYDPVKERLYEATLGQGAFCNGAKWELEPSPKKDKSPLTLLCDRSFKGHTDYGQIIKNLEEAALTWGHSGLEIVAVGGAVMNAIWTIEKAPACYFKFPKVGLGGGSLWDFAATACIFAELGACTVSDIQGRPLDLNRKDATFMNHRGIVFASEESLKDLVIKIAQEHS